MSGRGTPAPILLEGLARLEYRGYDSAGIALVTPRATCSSRSARARWPSCGRRSAMPRPTPSGPRAHALGHPRAAQRPQRPPAPRLHAVSLRSSTTGSSRTSSSCAPSSTAAGHRLDSETDTEVIAHLVEEAYHGDIAEAVRAALRRARRRLRARGPPSGRARAARGCADERARSSWASATARTSWRPTWPRCSPTRGG